MAGRNTPPSSSPEPETQESDASRELAQREGRNASFPIVGIGASAGGLEAMSVLLKALPPDIRMAFVLVPHLSPNYESLFAEILQRVTRLPVVEVTDEPEVRPETVYVIPPNRSMVMTDGHLKLLPRPAEAGIHRPIDTFLRSLAENSAHQAVGVVLSGTGNDGTLGLEAIKAEGGITFAQDDTAQHGGMPRSAVASGCVDFVLPPDKIAEELGRIGRHPYVAAAGGEKAEGPSFAPLPHDGVRRVLRILKDATPVDVASYKTTTLYRRITRRMLLHKLDGVGEYVRFLQANPAEIQSLYRDILINVTCFFRDPDAVEALKALVFPLLIKSRTRHDPLRVWVLGCSTGEEAYSLAIAIAEVSATLGLEVPVQIFATDLNEQGIEKARVGLYPKNIVQDVTPERLRRYFVETEAGYQIAKPVRDMCVFARQNVLSDPPFSRMDLITCRNLLIYMEPVLQKKVVPLFHYALKTGGFLWLGSSETIGSFSDLFEVVDAKHKIYSRKATVTPAHLVVPLTAPAWDAAAPASPRRRPAGNSLTPDLQKEADRLAIARYSPPGVLINADLEVVQFRGDTGLFLAPAPGKPSLNVLKMAREGLLVGLRSALQRAVQHGVPVRQEGLRVKANGGFKEVHLEVMPMRPGADQEPSYLILFERADGRPAAVPPVEPPVPVLPDAERAEAGEAAERQIARLTQELAATRDYLQSLVEQQEAANEELQSANEEIQSSNEELQSINEELQTSKEEIQSSNEELTTVNEELFHRNGQLSRANDDLTNFLASTELALVMLGRDLVIRRFTPQAEKLLHLIGSDVGRPIGDLNLPLTLPDLHSAIIEVIDTVRVVEREVQDRDGRWYSLRLRPYKTSDNRIVGAVLVLVDIDSQKRTELRLRASEEKYRQLVEGARDMAIMGLDAEGRVSTWNVGAERLFGYREEEIVGQPLHRFFSREDVAAGRADGELATARSGNSADDDAWLVKSDGSRFWANGSVTALFDDAGTLQGYTKIVRNVSERKKGEDALRESEERFRLLADHAPVLIWLNGPEGAEYVNRAYLEFLGIKGSDVRGYDWVPYVHPDDRAAYLGRYKQAYERGQRFEATFRFRRHDGEYRWMQSVGLPRLTPHGEILGFVGSTVDVDDIKRVEEALRDADRRKNEFLAVLAHELRNPLAPLSHALELLRAYPDEREGVVLSREVMDRQVHILTRMVEDLLDVSRIARGRIELKREVVDLRELLLATVENLRYQVEAKEQRLVVELPDAPVAVEGDPMRLGQVFANLLGNAVKYTDGGGEIGLSLAREGKEAVVRVRDTGIGIAPDLLPRIFELYTQGDTSARRQGGGLGIGLSLVRQLVELHKGTVEASSDGPGHGSTLEARLPLLSDVQYRRARWMSGAGRGLPGVPPVSRILVVDDNVDAAETLARLLRLFGHEVEVAFSGAVALEIAERFRPGLVLLDIGMPRMDGYEVARRLREQMGSEDMALVALSGYARDEDSQKAREAGFDLHLVKPVDPATLQQLLSGKR